MLCKERVGEQGFRDRELEVVTDDVSKSCLRLCCEAYTIPSTQTTRSLIHVHILSAPAQLIQGMGPVFPHLLYFIFELQDR